MMIRKISVYIIFFIFISIFIGANAEADDYLFKEEANDDFWSVKIYGDDED